MPFTPVIVLFLISINAMDINSLKAHKVLISIIELYTNYMDNRKLINGIHGYITQHRYCHKL